MLAFIQSIKWSLDMIRMVSLASDPHEGHSFADPHLISSLADQPSSRPTSAGLSRARSAVQLQEALSRRLSATDIPIACRVPETEAKFEHLLSHSQPHLLESSRDGQWADDAREDDQDKGSMESQRESDLHEGQRSTDSLSFEM